MSESPMVVASTREWQELWDSEVIARTGKQGDIGSKSSHVWDFQVPLLVWMGWGGFHIPSKWPLENTSH